MGKVQVLLICLALFLLSSCQQTDKPSAEIVTAGEPGISTKVPTNMPAANAVPETIPLNFSTESETREENPLDQKLVAETVMQSELERNVFTIFKETTDTENAHSGVINGDKLYDLGEVSVMFEAEHCKLELVNLYGET